MLDQEAGPQIDRSGLKLWLPLNGSATDYSGSGNNATLNGSPSYADGASGRVLRLNGSSQYLDAGVRPVNAFSITNSYAIAIRAKSRVTKAQCVLSDNIMSYPTGSDSASAEIFDNNGQFWGRFKINGTQYTVSGGTWSAGQWYSIVLWYNGSTVRLYANGSLVNSTSASGSVYNSTSVMKIGRRSDFKEVSGYVLFYYDGDIADFRVYSSMSESRITAIARGEA